MTIFLLSLSKVCYEMVQTMANRITNRRSKRPTFFWQGLLIVMPVVVLAAVGLFSLRQDKLLVEQEARQQANQLIQQLATGLGRQVAGQLSNFEDFANHWFDYNYTGLSTWLGGMRPPDWNKSRPDFQGRFTKWSEKYPGLRTAEVLPIRVLLWESGELHWPLTYELYPVPPDWLTRLSSEQKSAWQAARLAEFGGATPEVIGDAYRKFLETEPVADARVNAQFALLRLQARNNPPDAAAVGQLLRFGGRHNQVQAESGLPLSALTFALELRSTDGRGLSDSLFAGLCDQVFHKPSLFTPHFLSEAERLAGTEPSPVKEGLRVLRECWEAQERLRGLTRRVQQSHPLTGITTTNLWVESPPDRWLAILNPSEVSDSVKTNVVTSIRFFPKVVIERTFLDTLRDLKTVVPAYFTVSAELEGERLALSGLPARLNQANDHAHLLAQSQGVLTQPAVRWLGHPINKPGPEFESLPSRPAFTLRLHLTDSTLLYARQRQRTVWFGGLIVAAALVAVIGFAHARRSFLRQRQLSEMKTNFVSSVSHELRAPIASVRLMAESLDRGRIQDTTKQSEYFRFIVQECRRLSSMIENVLNFSRIEQDRKQYEFEPTDLVRLVQETVKLMEPYAAERRITLSLALPDPQPSTDPPQPIIDGQAIQQALVNLLDNAIKHSPDGSTVTVGLETRSSRREEVQIFSPSPPPRERVPEGRVRGQRGSWFRGRMQGREVPLPWPALVSIWVEDHGDGIPPAEHERIFERFYRLGPELRRETQGVGIGLSIVKHIVEAHGGKVTVRSAVGQGSRFTIEIPTKNETSNIEH